MRAIPALAVALAVLAVVLPAAADEGEAKEAFARGKTLFNEEEYLAAADAFRRAHELKPNWRILYNIGQSEAAAKRHGLALEAFEAYLSQGGDDLADERREEVLSEVSQLRMMVGYLEVVAPDRARVVVDGVLRGEAPLNMLLPVAVGVPHQVGGTFEGGALAQRSIQVPGEKTVRVVLEPGGESPSGAGEPPPEEKEQVDPRRLQIAGWIVTGIGAALLVGGGVTGGLALGAKSDLDEKCPDGCYSSHYEELDRRDNLALATDVLLGVGGAVAVTGVVLLVVAARRGAGEEHALLLSPTVAAGRGGATLEWRF